MNVNTVLSSINEMSQSIVKFLFGSKWSISIVVLIVIIYFVWKGLENKEKKNVESTLNNNLGEEQDNIEVKGGIKNDNKNRV